MAGFWKKSLLVVVVIGGGYFGYKHFYGAGGAGDAGVMGGAPPVSVAEVKARKVQLWSNFSGKLVAVDSVEIRPRVSGTIEKIHFKEGEWVEKGSPLFTIDRKPYEAALQAAKAKESLASAEFARAKELIKDKAIPQKEFDQRKSDMESARADLTRAQLDYDYSVIKSPISGQVGRAEVTVGNLVDAGGNAPVLTTVVTNKPIYADFDIDEQTYLRYLQDVSGDAKKFDTIPVNLGLSGEDGAPHTGHVKSFDNQLNTGSGTLRVRAVFDNKDGGLIPGLFASVQMGAASEKEMLLVNEHAINTDQSIKFVWVVGEDNKVLYRPVKLGGMAEGLRIITDGLKEGEKIVIGGTQRVMMPNQTVTPQIVDMEGKGEGKEAPDGKAEPETPAEKAKP